jgi:hypothetical protein
MLKYETVSHNPAAEVLSAQSVFQILTQFFFRKQAVSFFVVHFLHYRYNRYL